MKNNLASKCLGTAFICIFLGCGPSKRPLWEENFTGKKLNEEVWNYEIGDGCPELCGWGNNEPQTYTDKNHYLKDGFLHIVAKKSNNEYTSTRINTKDKFQFKYGRIEARAKLPVGKGVWPAIWMLGDNIDEVGWPMCGEVDIVEYVGREPHRIFNSLHTKDSHGETINTKKTEINDIENGFHLYEANWKPDEIVFSVDGKIMYTFNPKVRTTEVWPFDQAFYFIVNLAVGGNFGGPEVDDAIFPQEFIVDYIKVYKN